MLEHLAVIDLGSNSVRLAVTEIQNDGSFKNIIERKEPVRLSENMGSEKILKKPAIERTISTLKSFKEDFKDLENVHLKAVATAATRMAKNQKDFLDEVMEKTGIELEVITGTTEAYYDYLGVINSLPVVNGIIMDTGGASTELVLVQNRRAMNLISLPFGSVTLSEGRINPDVVSAGELFRLSDYLNNIFNDIWWLSRATNLPIIGLGGSNRTLAKIKRRRDADRKYWDDIHGFHLSNQEAKDIFLKLLNSDLADRKMIPGVSKERADIIVGGLCPAMEMMKRLNSDRMIFGKQGLRYGVLYEHLNSLKSEGKISK
ncbi:Ppx/GppA family phosphatase [Apilactobacillus apisilvae]|uniref:Ppx/GppA family phosphatase n=1 Tax=Apilactobacillus apisilvae TaxID=2923364 RepID=A0ABY4PK80_9LACO|nr:Ppx/GppA family phosphatase [Apilactobacillus apisilvae]UQS85756.1 Ppx/GppA family phosphatase [Apilactobacillus apisilvae]